LRGHSKLITVLLFLTLCLFLYGIVKLFTMRFEKGDVYPVYSSLRTDPLGTKVFYDSLNKLKDIATTRNYKAFSQSYGNDRATMFYFGAPSFSLLSMDKDDVESLETMIANGSRFVILLYPENASRLQKVADDKKQIKDKKHAKDGEDTDKKNDKITDEKRCGYLRCPVSLLDRWGFHCDFHEQFVQGDHAHRSSDISGTNVHNFPGSISWHSALYFDKINEAWEEVYTLKEHPVIIERTFGRGTIVISTDTYFVSNEALAKERHPALLAWLVGNNRTVVFDEAHFGLYEEPGIATLARKYRLHGLLAGILILGMLFIWKNSLSLVPAREDSVPDLEEESLTGKDFVSGFVSLLRRNIAPRDVLNVCFLEWKGSFPQRGRKGSDEMKRVQKIIDSIDGRTVQQKNIVQAYQKVNKVLGERKFR
jgi:hypothetical protein